MTTKTEGHGVAIAAFWRDVRYGLRRTCKSPGFAIIAILTIGLAVGANLAVFQLLYSVLFAPLPVQRPGELVAVHAVKSPFDGQWFFSYPAYKRLQQATGASAPIIARSGFGMGLLQTPDQVAQHTPYQLVSDNFFTVLGVRPAAGRLFNPSDRHPGQNAWPVVVRYGFALRHFGTPQIAGVHALLNGMPVVIIGVTEKRFLGVVTGYAPDIWLPLEMQSTGKAGAWFDSVGAGHGVRLDGSWLEQPGVFWLWLTARVPANQRIAAAAKWTATLQPDLALISEATPATKAKEAILHAQVRLVSAAHGEGSLSHESFLPLVMLMGLSIAVFLAGCLNLANLQAARLATRIQDFCVRMSLGATRWQLVRQTLTEDALLIAAGGVLAALIGRAASNLLLHWASTRDWLLNLDLHAGSPVLLLGTGMIILAGSLFGLMPAWHAISGKLVGVGGAKWMHAGAPQSARARYRSSAMLAVQVSLSLVLVTMAASFAYTLIHLSHIDTGMDREHVVSVHVDMVHGYAAEHANLPLLYRGLTEHLEAIPQVRAAAVEMCKVPVCGWNTALHVFGKEEAGAADLHGEEDHVGPGYFETMGIPLLRGRDFSDTDRADTQRVAILNEAYAKKLFGNADPIGHWVGYEAAPNDHEFLVVGEVGNARVDGPQRDAPPVAYMSIDQKPAPIHSIQVRTAGPAKAVAAELRQALHDFDPRLPVTEIVSLGTELEDGLTQQNLLARLTGVLAGLTLALAALGFYGVMSYRVARRRNEIGIRMALGATRAQVRTIVLRQTVSIVFAGVVPGLVLTGMVVHLARGLLYSTAAANWAVFGGAALALAAVGLVATIVPAVRASAVDPMDALRTE